MLADATIAPAIPLAHWADRQIASLASATGSTAIAALTGSQILGERANLNQFRIPGQTSCGGGTRLWRCTDGWIALNLARPDDRAMLPALFKADLRNLENISEIKEYFAKCQTAPLLAQGRTLGLAIASTDEAPTYPALKVLTTGPHRPAPRRPPLVVDLSALWAGPLAAHLLWLAGAEVVKVESQHRPDAMRQGDPPFYASLNQGKANVLANLQTPTDIAALTALLARADIVIEAARPRALAHLGIDAAKLVQSTPGLVWITITGHGATEEQADHIGFGDDCAVAGGLTSAIQNATGHVQFGGDAVADPLTGVLAAQVAWAAWQSGQAQRIALSMSSIVARAIAEDETLTPSLLAAWAAAQGQPFPAPAPRPQNAPLAPLGADTARFLPC